VFEARDTAASRRAEWFQFVLFEREREAREGFAATLPNSRCQRIRQIYLICFGW
jgi:hypothetical protein